MKFYLVPDESGGLVLKDERGEVHDQYTDEETARQSIIAEVRIWEEKLEKLRKKIAPVKSRARALRQLLNRLN